MNKNELSKRIDVSLKTLYNWEETKPELIKLIKLGLEKEKELANGNDNVSLNIELFNELKETIKMMKEQQILIKELKETINK